MFLDHLLGIVEPGQGEMPCIWCKCPRDKFGEYDAWKQKNPASLRSFEEAQSTLSKFPKGANGYSKKPITKLAFKKTTVDILHLFIRIAGKLIELFIIEITECLPVRTARRFFPHNCLLTNNKRDSRE